MNNIFIAIGLLTSIFVGGAMIYCSQRSLGAILLTTGLIALIGFLLNLWGMN